jgi:hypothetical protein
VVLKAAIHHDSSKVVNSELLDFPSAGSFDVDVELVAADVLFGCSTVVAILALFLPSSAAILFALFSGKFVVDLDRMANMDNFDQKLQPWQP